MELILFLLWLGEEEEGFWAWLRPVSCSDLQSVVLPWETRVFLGQPCSLLEVAFAGAEVMQELVAGVEKIRFDLEVDVEQQRGAQPLPFLGMDKLGSAVCEFFHRGLCAKGMRCPFRHVIGEKTVVCKHWLRGLCKKGDGCNFLHEYDATKMPECYFFSKFGECSNKDCPFLHIDSTTSTMGCPWYDRGFCRHGPLCKYKHTQRVMCANYLVGFCPEGPKCKFMHLKAGLMTSSMDPSKGAGCPRELVQLDVAAGEESGYKDVPPMKPPLPVTGSAQHLSAQLWDTNTWPRGPQSLFEQGTCFKLRTERSLHQ